MPLEDSAQSLSGMPPGSWVTQQTLSPWSVDRIPSPGLTGYVNADCKVAHPWDSPGEVILRTWMRAERDHPRRWLTVEHADPVVLISHELLGQVAFPYPDKPVWLREYARVTGMQSPFMVAGTVADASLDTWRSRDGRLHPHADGLLGALLHIYAANRTVVYRLEERVNEDVWLGRWPD